MSTNKPAESQARGLNHPTASSLTASHFKPKMCLL